MTTKVFVEINGSRQEVTRQELFDLAKQGIVQPDTRLFWGDKITTAATVRGIEFASPKSKTAENADAMENAMADLLMEGQSPVSRKQKKRQKQITESASVPKETGVSPETMAQITTDSITWYTQPLIMYGASIIGALLFVFLIAWLFTTSEQGQEALMYFGFGLLCMTGFFAIFVLEYYKDSKSKGLFGSKRKSTVLYDGQGFIWFVISICIFIGCLFPFVSTLRMNEQEWQQYQIVKQNRMNNRIDSIVSEEERQQQRNTSSSADEQAAISHAKSVVRSQLKAPSTAKFEWQPLAEHSRSTGQWRISGHVDAQNSFGVMIRNNYVVEVKKVNGTWQTIRCVVTE